MPKRRPKRPRTNAERSAATQDALLASARALFAERGYAEVGVAELARGAGVTTGAVYHHFGSKEGLFRALLEAIHAEVAERIAEAAAGLDPWNQLVTGCRAFLEASTAPEVQRIMLVDGPAVLGWSAWRELDARTSMRQLEEVLELLVREGEVADQPLAPLAHLLSGAMNEAALWLAQSDDRDRDLARTTAALTRMLEALRA
ncbi:MAG TPA: helix-turn-helix domain-containing protein [Solirubrobacterales bacterium]